MIDYRFLEGAENDDSRFKSVEESPRGQQEAEKKSPARSTICWRIKATC